MILMLMKNLALAVDQLSNTILLGHPDETISSRLGRAEGRERYIWVKWFRVLVNAMFWFDRGPNGEHHCAASVIPLEQTTFRTLDYELWSWQKE